jgi:hypothetical protein
MIARRIAVVTFVLLALTGPLVLAAQAGQKAPARDSGLAFGTFKFTGKDKAGVVWTGTLIVEKLDPDQFDPQKYVAQGDLRIGTADGAGKGANPPIAYDPATRVVTIGAESDYGGSVYTAVLSPDGNSMTKGAWRETERSSDEKEKRVVSEGEWSATRVGQ